MDIIVIVDAETGEVSERQMTFEEQAQRDADTAQFEKDKADREAQEAAAATARRKIAEASGLTPEEMAALGF